MPPLATANRLRPSHRIFSIASTVSQTRDLEDPAVRDAPVGRARRRALWIIGLFVGLQLVTPLTYYLRDDPYDERFAWRMFSAIRLHRCSPSASEARNGPLEPVDLERVIHRAWINTMGRNRQDVVEAYLERRCEEDGVTRVELRNDCVTAEDIPLAPQNYTRDCGTGEVTLPEHWVVETPTPSGEERP